MKKYGIIKENTAARRNPPQPERTKESNEGEIMSESTEKTRNLGIDLLCCIGVMMLLGLQYIADTGFTQAPIQGYMAALPIASRWFCLAGASLLAACMGYVMSTKKFSASYFTILIRPVYIYLVGTLCALAIRYVLLHEPLELRDTLTAVAGFSATETGRLIGMYIALLLAAPFVNAAFHGLKKRHARQAFLVVTAIVSTLQPMLYICGIYVIPVWCKGLFPLAAYIGGAYIRRYSKKRDFVSLFIFLISLCLAQTVVVLSISMTKGIMYCPWLDSMASLPCLCIALCLLGMLRSKKEGNSVGHRFFACGAGGALAGLLLGEPFLDCLAPALYERFPDLSMRLIAGWVVVPVTFIICCAVGLIIQGPVFLIRQAVRGEEEEEEASAEEEAAEEAPADEAPVPETEEEDDDSYEEDFEPHGGMPETTMLPQSTPVQPKPYAGETNPRHTISVPVSHPQTQVKLTQPPAEKPIGVHEVELPERSSKRYNIDDILSEQGVKTSHVPDSVDDLIAALTK